MNQELPHVQARFRKGRGTKDQNANICWIMEKTREFQNPESTSASLTMWKPLMVWITTNWKILKKTGVTDHLTCLLRSLYGNQEATVETRYGTMGSFDTGKGERQSCILSPCLFNVYAEYIM